MGAKRPIKPKPMKPKPKKPKSKKPKSKKPKSKKPKSKKPQLAKETKASQRNSKQIQRSITSTDNYLKTCSARTVLAKYKRQQTKHEVRTKLFFATFKQLNNACLPVATKPITMEN